MLKYQVTDGKVKEVYYEPDHLWTGSNKDVTQNLWNKNVGQGHHSWLSKKKLKKEHWLKHPKAVPQKTKFERKYK